MQTPEAKPFLGRQEGNSVLNSSPSTNTVAWQHAMSEVLAISSTWVKAGY